MNKAIFYRGLWLMPNSKAYTLHQEKKLKELDSHIKQVEAQYRATH